MHTVPALVSALERAAGRFVDDSGEQSLSSLADRVRRLAAGLSDLGLTSGSTIGLWLPNQREWVETVLAAGLLGARAAGINPRYRTEELEHAVAETGMTHLVYRPEFAGNDYSAMLAASDVADNLTLLRTSGEDELPAIDLSAVDGPPLTDPGAGSDDLWVIFFTSGTTSKPKAVVHTQNSLVVHAVHACQRQQLDGDGAVLATLPFCGVMGFVSMLEGLVVGASTVTLARFSAERTAALLSEHRITVWNSIDEMLRRVIDEPAAEQADLSTGAVANFGPNPAALLKRANATLGGCITQPYGMSEVQALVVMAPLDAPFDRHARPGGPIVTPGTEVRVVAPETNDELPNGEVGELQIRGTTVAAGYLRAGGDLHPLDGHDGWFATGDLAYREGDEITYLSRFKDVLRLRGFLVNPREIEDSLADHPAVREAQVVGVERDGKQVAVAFVLGDEPIDTDAVLRWMRERMADFKVPAAVVQLDSFPITEGPHGAKIKKDVLRERAERLANNRQ